MKTDPPAPCDLAIVGLGCLFPKADGPGAFWANVKHAVDCIGDVPPTHWDPADYFDADPKKPDHTYARRGGFLTPIDFNPLEYGIAPRDLEATDTTQLLGLVAAKQALADAKIRFSDGQSDQPGSVDRSRVSVILGVTGTTELVIPLGARLGHPKWKRAMADAGVADDLAADALERMAESYVPWQENSFPGLLGNVVAGRIANRLDLHGTNCVVDAACASSLSALHLAAMELESGRADVAVTGGADTFNDIFMFMCFSKTPALSPTGDARPFEAAGDGTILGEGLGMLVLKRLADATAAGDTVYCVLKGIGTSSDGKGNAIYAPSAEGQKRCLRDAYSRAGIAPETVELVEAHGTGTRVGDNVEASALAVVYTDGVTRTDRPWCALGSVKSMVGHTKAAAGAAGLIKAAMALYTKVLPPTLKVTKPVDALQGEGSPFYVNTQMRPWLPRADHPRRAGVSAFGFGGSNFHAVLEEHAPNRAEADWGGRVEVVALGAADAQGLAKELDALPTAWPAFARRAEASRAAFNVSAPCRLVLVAERDTTDLVKLKSGAMAELSRGPATPWQTVDGAYCGAGPAAGKLAVLFPGQGSQSVGMLREWACTFPESLDALAEADAGHSPRLSDLIHPPTDFAADAKARQELALRSTDAAQPALGAVSLGAWRVLSGRFGVAADTFAGHSYGELTALCAAGRLTPDEFFRLSRLRGRLMAEQAGRDAGAMLAVLAPAEVIEAEVARAGLVVVIANRNAPRQTVLSGTVAEVERAEQAFLAAGVRGVRLPVAAAFHSPLVADAAGPFRAALDAVPFPPGSVPVTANTTAKPYPDAAAEARDLLGHQLARPVEFVAQVRALAAAGVSTVLEVGPGAVLTRLVEATAAETGLPLIAFGVERSANPRSGVLDLAHALARLAALGHPVRLAAWEEDGRCRPGPEPKPGHTVPVGGANVVMPRPRRAPKPVATKPEPARPESPPASVEMPDPASAPDPRHAAALQFTQQTLAALTQIQEQTASLHRQFLESQTLAQQTLQQMVAGQQAFWQGGTPSLPPAPVAVPAPTSAAPPAPVAAVPAVVKPAPVAPPAVIAPAVAARPAANVNGAHPNGTHANGTHPAPTPARPAGIESILLAVVAEKTGYPVEMLDPSMALDADLGVDSIKRVEILSALQERLPDAPAVRPEHLGTLHTLRDIAAFLSGGQTATKQTLAVEIEPLPHPTPPTTLSTAAEALELAALGHDAPEDVESILLSVVAEKTGYPVEMLDPSMALDADLGVDSIKRVEILSALQERLPDAPAVRPEHLGTLHTLRDIAAFLSSGRPGPNTIKVDVSALARPSVADAAPADADDTRTERLSELHHQLLTQSLTTPPVPPAARAGRAGAEAAEPRGAQNPGAERIDRSILQVVDIDLASGRPRLPLPEGGNLWLVAAEGDALADEVATQLAASRFQVSRFAWAEPGANPGDAPVGLVLLAPQSPGTLPLNRLAYRWLQAAGPGLRQNARQSTACLVASVARLDGEFGLGNLDPAADPAAGGLAGLVKTARLEWPELGCKAIDVAPGYALESPAAAAAAVVDELLLAGPVEVGITARQRCTLELARASRRAGASAPLLGAQDVVLVSGGARGVTAEVAVALAESSRGTFVLTGRTPPPTGPEPEWLRDLTDEAALKKAIADHLGAAGTPKSVGEFYAKALAQREVSRTLARVRDAGGKATYYAVNVANGRQVADLIHQVTQKFGPVTALVHGAGVLADRKIEELTPEQFDAVYSTKVEGLTNLLGLLTHQELKAVVLFSSTTARFGRPGQLAYAVANEVLNKAAQVEARKRPGTRVTAINWGPWEGGMVTPALKRVFEAEGVGTIPLADGAAFAVQELGTPGRAVEVVALGKANRGGKPSPTGLTGSATIRTPSPSPGTGMPGQVLSGPPAGELSVVFERTLDVETHPVLRSHVLDGRAVLPMALHLEWLAHAALHHNPGLVFHGVNDLRITHGVMIEAGTTTPLKALAGRAVKRDQFFVVPVELRGRRRDGRDAMHSRAEIVLMSALPKAPEPEAVPAVQPYPHTVEEVYRHFLFHGPDLHALERVEGSTDTAFVATAYPAPAPSEWMASPPRPAWVTDPMVLDASFQMMILWSYAQHGAGSLPCFASRYRQYRRSFPAGPVRIVIRLTRDNGEFARADIDYLDADGALVAQLQDYECVIDRHLDQAFRRNQLGARAKA